MITAPSGRLRACPSGGLMLYIVVMDRGGIFGAWFDEARATEAAQNIGGVVCEVPITADFRRPEGRANA